MNKIAFVIPYFGRFPNYFDLWEYSASKNADIDFLIFTDSPRKNKYENVKYILYELDEIKRNIKEEVGFEPMLDSPYKIVDYKPLYGCIFSDFLKKYSHWGYCDSDVIFGNLKAFFTDEKLNSYDRIYQHGHMCIYKNEYEINHRWKTKHNLISYNYIECFQVRGVKMFDERGGMWDIWKENGWSQYLNEEDFADVLPTKHEFTTSWNKKPMMFHYQAGHLYEWNEGLSKQEFAYIHLQKRKMIVDLECMDDFFIKPNIFCNDPNIAFPIGTKTEAPVKRKCAFKRIKTAISNFDEIKFHFRVAFRRLRMYIKGENWHIKYKLY